MALKGLKVIELAGLAPAPFCGMILSDFGADVIRIEKPVEGPLDQLKRGKRTMSIDLKNASGRMVFKRLCSNADVLIDPFRPMVMENLGLGPEVLMELNKRLIYARLSGFGQNGDYASKAGHDLNYLAISGILSLISGNGRPTPPLNMLADFAGGGQTCALGILIALYERNKSGLGQVIDCSMVEGVRYLSSYIWHTQKLDSPIHNIVWPNKDKKESNLLDGGCPFYDVYKTKDGKWITVGALEPQFYKTFLNILGLKSDDYNQSHVDDWPGYKLKFCEVFATKTLDEWMEIYSKSNNSCVEPVLELKEAEEFDKIHTRESFLDDHTPKPAPQLKRTPAEPNLTVPDSCEHTEEVLREIGYSENEIKRLNRDGAIFFPYRSKL